MLPTMGYHTTLHHERSRCMIKHKISHLNINLHDNIGFHLRNGNSNPENKIAMMIIDIVMEEHAHFLGMLLLVAEVCPTNHCPKKTK